MFVPSKFAVHSHTKVRASVSGTNRFSIHGILMMDIVACCIGDGNNVRFLHIKFCFLISSSQIPAFNAKRNCLQNLSSSWFLSLPKTHSLSTTLYRIMFVLLASISSDSALASRISSMYCLFSSIFFY